MLLKKFVAAQRVWLDWLVVGASKKYDDERVKKMKKSSESRLSTQQDRPQDQVNVSF